MFTLVEQGIEVPKITLEDGIPQRAVLREPVPVEQLADVLVPESWSGTYHVAARRATGGLVAHPSPVVSCSSCCLTMVGVSPPAQGGIQILGVVVTQIQEQILVGPCVHAAQVPAVRAVPERECASDSVHRQTFGLQVLVRTVQTVQLTGDSTVQFSVVDALLNGSDKFQQFSSRRVCCLRLTTAVDWKLSRMVCHSLAGCSWPWAPRLSPHSMLTRCCTD